jgi:hypothetical protein
MPAFDHSITETPTSNGTVVTARYLNSPNYDPQSNVCACLHWVFLLYSPERNHARAYLLRDAIELFLDFRHLHNSNNPEPLHIKKYTDINSEIFNRYVEYMRDLKQTMAKPEILKSAIKLVAEDTGKLPLLTLPIVPMGERKGKNAPLSSEGLKSLEYALTSHINLLWEKFTFRDEVEDAQPYTAAEINELLWPTATRVKVLQSWHYFQTNNLKPRRTMWISRLSASPDPALQALANDPDTLTSSLKAIYQQEVDQLPEFDTSKDPLAGVALSFWAIDYPRVVKTFLVHGYPLEMSLEVLYDEHRNPSLQRLDDFRDDVIKLILYRFTIGNRMHALRVPTVDQVLGMYFPTLLDMTALLLFMMLQSGWNKETALSVDKDNFESLLTGTIEEAVRIVFAEKTRSQGQSKPYTTAKRMELPTSSEDPYSFYNLIRLAKYLSEPLSQYPIDQIPQYMTEEQMNPMFLCMRPREDWSRGGRLTSISHPKTFRICVQQFLALYDVVDEGKRLTNAASLTRRLRPTWLLHKKQDNPVAILSVTMGHVSRDTTDIFYDNSAAAHGERLKRLRSELEAVIDLLRARKYKGLLGKHAQAQASEKWKIFHIPGLEKPLWACADQTKPNWVGSEIIASTGRKCWKIKECIFCSQFRVFQDSLPYLIERESHLSALLESGEGGFTSRFAKEREAIDYILSEWGNDKEVEQAGQYRLLNIPLLPRDLDLLEIIFESEEHNV